MMLEHVPDACFNYGAGAESLDQALLPFKMAPLLDWRLRIVSGLDVYLWNYVV